MEQCLDNDQALGKLNHRQKKCQNQTQGWFGVTPVATAVPPGGPACPAASAMLATVTGVNPLLLPPGTQPCWHQSK